MKERVFLLIGLLLLISSSSATGTGEEFLNLKWNYSLGQTIGEMIVKDFDNDGEKEIVVTTSYGGELFFIETNGSKIWRTGVFCPIYSLNSVKFTSQESQEEILVGSCTHLNFFSSSGEKEGQYFTFHAPVQVIFPLDVGADGKMELLLGSGDPSTSRKNNLFLIDKDKNTLWRRGLSHIPYSIDAGDLNADGLTELVVGERILTSRVGTLAGKISVYDEKGNLEWEKSLKEGVYQVKIEDIDQDGNFEIIAGSFHKVYVFDKKGEEKWSYETGGPVHSLEVVKIKGEKKLIVGSTNLLVFDSQLNLEWEYDTEDEIYVLKRGDLNKDGFPEIFAGSNKLYIFSYDGKKLWNSESFTGITGLSWDDLDGDNYQELIISTAEGEIYVFETSAYVKKEKAAKNLEKAQQLYEKKRYTEALTYALKAKGLYQELNQEKKAKQARDLVIEINATLSENSRNIEEAQKYWNKSLNFYLVNDYKSALLFARKAKLYLESVKKKDQEIEEKLEKYDSLINNSLAGLKLMADDYYSNASKLYKSKKLLSALKEAQEAVLIYEWINSSKVEESKVLLAAIYYSLAEEAFQKSKLENATLYAERALELYNSLGNNSYMEEIKKSKELLKKIPEGPSSFLENFISLLKKNLVLILGGGIAIVSLIIILLVLSLRQAEQLHEPTSELKELKEVEEPKEEKEEKEEGKPEKPKRPILEPIAKDDFKGIGRSLKI